jgi:hypothetical protein
MSGTRSLYREWPTLAQVVSLFHAEEREDTYRGSQLLFPITEPHDWLERGE